MSLHVTMILQPERYPQVPPKYSNGANRSPSPRARKDNMSISTLAGPCASPTVDFMTDREREYWMPVSTSAKWKDTGIIITVNSSPFILKYVLYCLFTWLIQNANKFKSIGLDTNATPRPKTNVNPNFNEMRSTSRLVVHRRKSQDRPENSSKLHRPTQPANKSRSPFAQHILSGDSHAWFATNVSSRAVRTVPSAQTESFS